MKLAFYYHIPLRNKNGQLYAPSYLGIFLEELAKNVSELLVVFHAASGKDVEEADYAIKGTNIKGLDLGPKTAAWHRSFFPGLTLKNKLKEVELCDAFLIRSPSPLASAFQKHIKHPQRFFMIVGDYAEGAKQLGSKGLKNRLLQLYFNATDKQFKKQFPSTSLFVNSPQLYEQYKHNAKSIQLIKTTTLTASDFYKRENHELQTPIQLLYTGRIEITKGLKELVDATYTLIKQGKAVHLNIVGWENNPQKPFEQELLEKARQLGIEQHITFHGKKQVGEELNSYYRNADIYVLPSYHEGFPRTIWEAMANSLPVIATKVGGIPFYLTNNEHALLIPAKSSEAIVQAVKQLVNDPNLCRQLVQNGYDLVQENALERQTFLMVEAMKDQMK